MRSFNNYLYLLYVALVVVFVEASWAAGIAPNEHLQRDVLPNNDQHRENPNAGIGKQVDQRISDIIAENVLHFGHNVGLELAALDPNATRSEIFSPLSLMAALSLLTLGAKGKSYQELKQILGLDSDSELIQHPNKYHEEFGSMLNDLQHTNVNSGGLNKRPNANWRYTTLRQAPVRSSNRKKPPVEHIIKVANGLFIQNSYTLNPDYREVLQSIYETEFAKLDFQVRSTEAANYINSWVSKATFGKIPKIIRTEIDRSTRVILASALYFKAFWQTPFFFGATTEENFYPDGLTNPPIKVQLMPTGGIFPFYDAKEYDCRIIGLPYNGNETTLYVIQPNDSTRQKLRELQRMLNAYKINNMIDKMERKTTVMVFPKMHFRRSLQLKQILQTMNINDVFNYGDSDLSLIGGGPQTFNAEIPNAVPSSPVMQIPPLTQFAPETSTTEGGALTFESIHRQMPVYQDSRLNDRFNETALVFSSRFGEIDDSNNGDVKNSTMTPIKVLCAEKVSTYIDNQSIKREKRQVADFFSDKVSQALFNLEASRHKVDSYKPDLFVDEILHDVDFTLDEYGTEAAAATLTYLHRSGTDVVFRGDRPFLILIRHDPTKLPLFYGIINKPEL